MQNGMKFNGQMRALGIALGGAIAMSVIAMFIPVSLFEAITGSTGMSELVPAMAAPLGDTARAMIAFAFGAATFALLALLLLRAPVKAGSARSTFGKAQPEAAAMPSGESFIDRMRAKIDAFLESRRGGVVVTDLADLPKLRSGDAHPDAPPRRPISAHRDFAEIAPEPLPVSPEMPERVNIETENKVTEPPLPAAVVEPLVVASAIEASDFNPTLPVAPSILPHVEAPQVAATEETHVTALVDRLENAVSHRQAQLDKLEALAKGELAKPTVDTVSHFSAPLDEAPRQTILEAVPSVQAGGEEMDAALRSALETLHRMNARTR